MRYLKANGMTALNASSTTSPAKSSTATATR